MEKSTDITEQELHRLRIIIETHEVRMTNLENEIRNLKKSQNRRTRDLLSDYLTTIQPTHSWHEIPGHFDYSPFDAQDFSIDFFWHFLENSFCHYLESFKPSNRINSPSVWITGTQTMGYDATSRSWKNLSTKEFESLPIKVHQQLLLRYPPEFMKIGRIRPRDLTRIYNLKKNLCVFFQDATSDPGKK